MPSNRTTAGRTLPWVALMATLAAVGAAGCDEDRATPVAASPVTAPQPNAADAGPRGPKEKNPISGNRKSTYGKAYDVAEDLVDNKIPEYNKRLEEEMEKNKP